MARSLRLFLRPHENGLVPISAWKRGQWNPFFFQHRLVLVRMLGTEDLLPNHSSRYLEEGRAGPLLRGVCNCDRGSQAGVDW